MSDKSGGQKPGSIVIAETVVSKIAGMAAGEVQGVRMGGGASQAAGSLIGSITGGGESRTQGVSVEVGEREAAIDLTMSTEYGKAIPQLTQAVRDNVVKSVERMTGLKVTEVNATVSDIYFPDEGQNRELPSASRES